MDSELAQALTMKEEMSITQFLAARKASKKMVEFLRNRQRENQEALEKLVKDNPNKFKDKVQRDQALEGIKRQKTLTNRMSISTKKPNKVSPCGGAFSEMGDSPDESRTPGVRKEVFASPENNREGSGSTVGGLGRRKKPDMKTRFEEDDSIISEDLSEDDDIDILDR